MSSLTRKTVGLIACGGVLVVVATACVAKVVHDRRAAQTVDPVAGAKQHLQNGNPAAALAALREPGENADPAELAQLEVEAVAAQRDVWRLAALYDTNRDAVMQNDQAARLAARTASATGDDAEAERIQSEWDDKSDAPHAWLCLKADRLIRSGDAAAARAVLRSREFEGEQDAGRMLRLAMLSVDESPDTALEIIDAAALKAPRSGDVHVFRAQLLETLGRLPEARVAYVTACVAAPKNPFYRAELADFYRRRGNLRFALKTWSESLALEAPGPAWLKTLFWSRVAHPVNARPTTDSTIRGRLEPLVNYLDGLPADRFWDEDAFAMLVSAPEFSRRHQEVFWLRLLEALRSGQEKSALSMLHANTFRPTSWNVLLEESLISLLEFRSGNGLTERTSRSFNGLTADAVHPLIGALFPEADGAPAPNSAAFLRSENAIPATLLACGWMEAALRMPHGRVLPDEAPHHMAFAMTQAYRSNRSLDEAIAVGMRQPNSPAMETLLGELHLAVGRAEEAVGIWRLAAADQGPAGYRASWLLARQLMESGRLDEAGRVVTAHADLSAATIGQELLARIALAGGDVAAAEGIYEKIAANSIDARIFSIRKELAVGNLAEARAIGEQLFATHPDVLSVRRLMLQLAEAEKEQAAPEPGRVGVQDHTPAATL